ncbi:hypothetical protein PIIN_05890 [Serendipita indica DSM 11827]|uniref:Uncharacterized protein n=1 Tax=Serendipita indica (strain DSM 11827) TaxID=1109443 RepID=G4TKW2_SERID|nr:hypothetical protein PIIN_05890 [Serendipita indica DSM 11827]
MFLTTRVRLDENQSEERGILYRNVCNAVNSTDKVDLKDVDRRVSMVSFDCSEHAARPTQRSDSPDPLSVPYGLRKNASQSTFEPEIRPTSHGSLILTTLDAPSLSPTTTHQGNFYYYYRGRRRRQADSQPTLCDLF